MNEHEDTFDNIERDQRHEEEQRPVREAGGGESEGFEEAERELVENASHSSNGPDPSDLAGRPEEDQPDAEFGEADAEEKEDL